jgi:hypothetical protein
MENLEKRWKQIQATRSGVITEMDMLERTDFTKKHPKKAMQFSTRVKTRPGDKEKIECYLNQ